MINHSALNGNNNGNRFEAEAGSASDKTMRRKAKAGKTLKDQKHAIVERKDICQSVTDAIVRAIEAGTRPWAQSWKITGQISGTPLRHNGQRYRGINILILWAAQMECGYRSPFWMTYKQAGELGGQVRKGEKGTTIVYYGTHAKDEADQTAADIGTSGDGPAYYRFLKGFSVFNVDQIDSLPERYQVKPGDGIEGIDADRIPEIDALIDATGATITNGGNMACYLRNADLIRMPLREAFPTPELYYATLFHELTHWTMPKHRLDRDFGRVVPGDEGYAKEELVAELGAAFLGAEFGFGAEHIEVHASYIASWVKVLKDDKRFIFKAAAKAQEACDYLAGQRSEQIAVDVEA